jgi:hypothetical protein
VSRSLRLETKSGARRWYVGAVMQHMAEAKLDCVLGHRKIKHNSFTTSDEQRRLSLSAT